MTDTLALTGLIFIAALLYSSVGHGGASGYLAAMALYNIAPSVMKPTALVLNLFVASIGTLRFARAGCFFWRIFWPFAAASVPFAFLGGNRQIPPHVYKVILGVVLLFAAFRLAMKPASELQPADRPIFLPAALVLGAAIGFLSGLTAVGGGIFLSPLLLFMRWADIRKTAGVSAAFILVNSAAGLLGLLARGQGLGLMGRQLTWWVPAALLGGLLGAELGSRRLPPMAMRRLLAAVLLVAGLKMLITR